MTSLAVLGPGGVGGFLAAALAHAGEAVTVVAREETAALIDRDGLQVESVRLGNFRAHPAAVPRLTEPVPLLFVATKATTLIEALSRVDEPPQLIVPLLNGLDHMSLLRARFGADRVAAGTIRIEADRPQPGMIVQTSPFLRVDLAAQDAALWPALTETAQTLERAGIPAEVEESETTILWSKLVRLAALACTTSACDCTLGTIREDPRWRAELEGAIADAAAAALAEGADIDPAKPIRELDEAHPGLGSSMQRDIAAGREPELDAIAGSVLRAAARHGLGCPTIARLAAMVAERAGIAPPRVP